METKKIGLIFDGENISASDRERVENELKEIGKMLTFEIQKDENGWIAKCNEVAGIIAGGTNSNPDDSEIKFHIRKSIFAAFNVETEEPLSFSFQETNLQNGAIA